MFLNRKALFTGVGIVLCGVLVAAWFMSRPAPVGTDGFQEQHAVRLELPGRDGNVRTVEMYPDGRTRKHGIEDTPDGLTSHYWYRPDGTLERAETYGKADESTGQRPLLRKSQMAADGITFLTDFGFYADGTPSKKIELLADGMTTLRTYYFESGKLQKEQVMSLQEENKLKVWKLTNELALREDGSTERTYVVEPGVSTIDTLFAPDGNISVVKTHKPKSWTYTEVWYYPNGVSPQREVSQNTSGTTIVSKRLDGTISQTMALYGEVAKPYHLTVTVFDLNGKKRIEQTYSFHEERLKLRSVDIYNEDGKRKRQFTMSLKNPEIVESEIFFDEDGFSGPRRRRNYREDGTLAKEWRESKDSKTLSETTYESSTVRADVEPDWTKLRVTYTAPQVVPWYPED